MEIEDVVVCTVEHHNGVSKQIERIGRAVYDGGYHEGVISEGVAGLDGEIDIVDEGDVKAIERHADDVHALVVIKVGEGESFVGGC